MEKIIKHIGIPRRSGRYPWGSGKNPYQRNKGFLGYVYDLKKEGLSEAEIASGLSISIKKLRARITAYNAEIKASDIALAYRLKEKGYSNVAIGERLERNESYVRDLLNPITKERNQILFNIVNELENQVKEKGYIDVGSGLENHLGVSRTKLDTALSMLEDKGYFLSVTDLRQVTSGQITKQKVLALPGSTKENVFENRHNVKFLNTYSEDGGATFKKIVTPKSIDSERIYIRYYEDGGVKKDGVIELRRGIDDLSLGGNRYAQVRIAVDGDMYMKGMAIYSDNIPDGYDIVYNSNKKRGALNSEVFKPMTQIDEDPNAFFGTTIFRQNTYTDKNGKKILSPINIVGYKEGEGLEGSWDKWSRALSSQVLSKQAPELARKQLKLILDIKKEEYDEIMSLTNSSVKEALLKSFSDQCDSDSVHLKAAALSGTSNHVILPLMTIKSSEVYATKYNDGDIVVLIRHPHAGPFEIPQLVVNNSNKEGQKVIGNGKDAVGIHPDVAHKLSGADFDGDTVLVIKNEKKDITIKPSLKALEDFEPKEAYKNRPGIRLMDARTKGIEMGKISNLITDMTIQGANSDEIARAVKHSMVVIDSEKHKLDYMQSYYDNNIPDLNKKYQGKSTGGAATIISRAGAIKRINIRKPGEEIVDPVTGKVKRIYIDPVTGKKLYRETGETYIKREPIMIDPVTGKQLTKIKDPVTRRTAYVDDDGNITKGRKRYFEIDPITNKKVYYDKEGKIVERKEKVKRLSVEEDAYKLSSGTKIENIYAEHANSLKALANKARLSMINVEHPPTSSSAKITYKKEVDTLKADLDLVFRNKPLERQAHTIAGKNIRLKRLANPDLYSDEDSIKKLRTRELDYARAKVGAKRQVIPISDKQWEAIQAGAVSKNLLRKILQNSDLNILKERSMPRFKPLMSNPRILRAQSLLASGHTRAEIARALGVSISTLDRALEGN